MGGLGNYTGLSLPHGAVFVPMSVMQTLTEAVNAGVAGGANPTVRLQRRPRRSLDPSALIVFLLGVAATVLGSYRAAREERKQAIDRLNGSRSNDATAGSEKGSMGLDDPESQAVTMGSVVGFICGASGSLLGLFFLMQAGFESVIFILIGLFGVGTTAALSHIVVAPAMAHGCCRSCWKGWRTNNIVDPRHGACPSLPLQTMCGPILVAELLPFAVAACTVIFWAVNRHEWYAWILQDINKIFSVSKY
jgi:hypothetical protein